MINAFVSFTYQDLKVHRSYVIERLQPGDIYGNVWEWTRSLGTSDKAAFARMEDINAPKS
jgi:hypothetical protein